MTRQQAETGYIYDVMETVKDGQFLDGKYASTIKRMEVNPHVVCFANNYPDTKQISEDRWQIYDI